MTLGDLNLSISSVFVVCKYVSPSVLALEQSWGMAAVPLVEPVGSRSQLVLLW